MMRRVNGNEDELGPDLYWMAVDVRAAQIAQSFLTQEERRKRFCREYRNQILAGLDDSEAALAVLKLLGYAGDTVIAIAALIKVATRRGLDHWCRDVL